MFESATSKSIILSNSRLVEHSYNVTQGRVQDLKKGGAGPIARKVCAQNFSHAPKTLTTPLINVLANDKEGCFRLSIDEKLLFRERIFEASKFIVGLSYQLLIISNNSVTLLSLLFFQTQGVPSPIAPRWTRPCNQPLNKVLESRESLVYKAKRDSGLPHTVHAHGVSYHMLQDLCKPLYGTAVVAASVVGVLGFP